MSGIGGQMQNQAKIDNALVAIETSFMKSFMIEEDPLRVLAREDTTDKPTVDHKWIALVGSMIRWTGQRPMQSLRAENITTAVVDWAQGVVMNKNDIMDDNLGLYASGISDGGQAAGLHYGEMVVEALLNGFVTTSMYGACYDGKALFSATHQEGEGSNQSNTGTAVLSEPNFWTAWEAMASFTDEFGRPLKIKPNTLVVGASNYKLALQILGAELINDGANVQVTNVTNKLKFNLLYSPSLVGDYANYWFMADLSRSLRPIGVAKRQPIQTGFSNAKEFSQKELAFGWDSRDIAWYALWQLIWGSTGAG